MQKWTYIKELAIVCYYNIDHDSDYEQHFKHQTVLAQEVYSLYSTFSPHKNFIGKLVAQVYWLFDHYMESFHPHGINFNYDKLSEIAQAPIHNLKLYAVNVERNLADIPEDKEENVDVLIECLLFRGVINAAILQKKLSEIDQRSVSYEAAFAEMVRLKNEVIEFFNKGILEDTYLRRTYVRCYEHAARLYFSMHFKESLQRYKSQDWLWLTEQKARFAQIEEKYRLVTGEQDIQNYWQIEYTLGAMVAVYINSCLNAKEIKNLDFLVIFVEELYKFFDYLEFVYDEFPDIEEVVKSVMLKEEMVKLVEKRFMPNGHQRNYIYLVHIVDCLCALAEKVSGSLLKKMLRWKSCAENEIINDLLSNHRVKTLTRYYDIVTGHNEGKLLWNTFTEKGALLKINHDKLVACVAQAKHSVQPSISDRTPRNVADVCLTLPNYHRLGFM